MGGKSVFSANAVIVLLSHSSSSYSRLFSKPKKKFPFTHSVHDRRQDIAVPSDLNMQLKRILSDNTVLTATRLWTNRMKASRSGRPSAPNRTKGIIDAFQVRQSNIWLVGERERGGGGGE